MKQLVIIVLAIFSLTVAALPTIAQNDERTTLTLSFSEGARLAVEESWFTRAITPSQIYQASLEAMTNRLGIVAPTLPKDKSQARIVALKFFSENIAKLGTTKERDVLLASALHGLLASWDQYMSLFNHEDLLLTLAMLGFFDEGDGLLTSRAPDALIVDEVLEEMPGAKAGILAEDQIIAINGMRIPDISDPMAYRLERDVRKGKISLTYTIKRGEKTFNVEVRYLKREKSEVKTELFENKIGYIMIPPFDLGVGHEVVDAIESLINRGARSMIIDLRKNPGGLAWEEQIALSIFKDGPLYSRRGRSFFEIMRSLEVEKPFRGPIAILVDKDSASAAEVFTFTMKGNRGTRIFGENTRLTYGKGVGQGAFRLPNGWFFYITFMEIAGLDNVSYHGKGVEVDELVDTTHGIDQTQDILLLRAIQWLKTQPVTQNEKVVPSAITRPSAATWKNNYSFWFTRNVSR